jgi:hypothetical protein
MASSDPTAITEASRNFLRHLKRSLERFLGYLYSRDVCGIISPTPRTKALHATQISTAWGIRVGIYL